MNVASRLIALLLIVSLMSCSTVPLPVAQVQQMRAVQNMPTLSTWTIPVTENPVPFEQSERPYFIQTISNWTGDGGRGRSITILPPRGINLTESQAYLPDLIANELVSNFQNFSDMTLFDRVNNQRQYEELLSGYYADTDAAGMDLGNLASTDYMLLGTITRTTTGYTLQLTVNRNSDKRTMATYSATVSILDLDNLTGVRRASLDLLPKLGVQLTSQARAELGREATVDHVSAMTAMAHGINAQRQGTEVAALTYFFQAAAIDASLTEAISRTNILNANISTGNIGANVRNDIAWRRDWVDKLTETENFINNALRTQKLQRSIWYTTEIKEQESARDYTRETTELRIEAALHTHAMFPVSIQRTVQAVYDGLQTTGRAQAWELNNWPRRGVTNNNPFNSRWGETFSVGFELLNDRNQVIGRQLVEMESRFNFNGTRLEGPGTVFATVRFTGVSANAITDNMSIRIAAINRQAPEQAGISRIEPIAEQRMNSNKNWNIYAGAIRPASNRGELSTVTIPSELWGERVSAIANNAFERRSISRVNIPSSVTHIGNSAFANNRITSVTFSEGLVSIGDKAFADNMWTERERNSSGEYITRRYGLQNIVLPSSVTSIGNEAFLSHWTTSTYSDGRTYTYNHYLVNEVTIGSNVNLGSNSIGSGFEQYYNSQSKVNGVYRRGDRGWERFSDRATMQETIKKRDRNQTILGVIVVAGLLGGLIFAYSQGWIGQDEE